MIRRWLRRIIPERLRPGGYLFHLVRQRTGQKVRQGPFAGMKYIDDAVGSVYLPKLLGIYERELNGCIEEICSANPTLIVDIGAAEGYYAVGLALRNRQSRVVAFETQIKGQEGLREMARLNRISEGLEVLGECEPGDLQRALEHGERTAIVCDVEGFEAVLLDPVTIPELRHAMILVEMHEFKHRGITDELRTRFAATHSVELIWQEARNRVDFPYSTLATQVLPARYLESVVSERRPETMSWLWMVPATAQRPAR